MAVTKVSITAQVFDFMKDQILNGSWQVGEKIPSENSLRAQLQCSRSSIRSAISQFIALGIMRSEQGKGTFLVSSDFERLGSMHTGNGATYADYASISAVLEFRRLIEPQAVRWLERLDSAAMEALLQRLSSLNQLLKDSVGDHAGFIEHDQQFHLCIASSCGNEVLTNALSFTFEHTLPRHQRMNELFGFANGLNYHRRILEALEKRAFKKAAGLMHEHLQHAIDQLAAEI